eukprot:TRINITY_DN122422_c0_g1_i1.p1 TRINITY_DN122422_c0_g1~~TRINITY_DN122422_c0_g1_i1.p1  ORF type:complete len:408 (-),score=55.15 TRINITY_DN122422_c0_g1_i1:212-1435(-)
MSGGYQAATSPTSASDASPKELTCRVESVWERHPVPDVKEQPVHFVRKQTPLLKEVGAMGLEDSTEWHRANYHKFMHDEPFDRAILINCKQHYEDLKANFPKMKHYWEEQDAGFGEQLLIDGLDAEELCLGDILKSKDNALELQVTCPRLCCFRVDHRYPAIPEIAHSGEKGTVRQYASSNSRGGFFCKVLQPGLVQEGHEFVIERGHYKKYPLAYLAELLYKDTPLSVNFLGTPYQLAELCDCEDLCMFEWRERLIDLKAHRSNHEGEDAPDIPGEPVPYEEGLKLIRGEWCTTGSAKNPSIHERTSGRPALARTLTQHFRAQLKDTTIHLRLEGNSVHSDKPVFGKKHVHGHVRNNHGHFAMEIDCGGFPIFPRYAYMTRVGAALGEVFLVISSGGKWRKIPDDS